MRNATEVLEELIRQMGDGQGPIERIVGEWHGPEVEVAAASMEDGEPRRHAMAVVDELGESWGATGDPTWVEGLLPEPVKEDRPELDFMFALYHRPRIYAYARLRGDDGDPPRSMRMILGVLRKPADHGD